MVTSRILFTGALSTIVVATAFAVGKSPDVPAATLKSVDSGAMQKAGYYMPQRLMLSATKPSFIVKEPAYTNKPMYGDIKFGVSEEHIGLALDEAPDGSAAKLYIDSN